MLEWWYIMTDRLQLVLWFASHGCLTTHSPPRHLVVGHTPPVCKCQIWSVQIRHISCNGRLGPFFLLPSHMPHIVVTARISRTQYKRIYKETLWCKRTISKYGMCVTLSSWLCALRNGAARPADAARAAVWPRGTARPVPARLCVHLDGTRGACCILSRRVTQPLAGPRGDSAA